MTNLFRSKTSGLWRLLVALGAGGLTILLATGTANAAAHERIQGSGSSWATNAINVWVAGVTASGLTVDFTSVGSGQGRKDFGNATTDFAVSDIGYLGKDPQNGSPDVPCQLGGTSNCRGYAYLPIVAGGTSFPYHVDVAGQRVRNIRMSGETIAKIFTGAITNWNDPQITSDNNGKQLPSIPITPVVHAEPSGSSAQFTGYLNKQYPAIWSAFNGGPGATEYLNPPSNGRSYTGSDSIINQITSASGNGFIGYDEYSYALATDYPVIKLENAAGNFTLPTQFNVAVALRAAQINQDTTSKDYLLQDLTNVYTNPDPRTYPLSSYSYGIIPTDANDPRMTTGKRQTLADFLYYSVCQGQDQIGSVGYSSLPLNLVQDSFNQIGKLKTADKDVDLTSRDVTTCNNPTFVPGDLSANHLADIAPAIPACDMSGAGPCTDAGDPGTAATPAAAQAPAVAAGGANGGGAAGGAANSPGSKTGGKAIAKPKAGSTKAAGGGENGTIVIVGGVNRPGSAATAGGTAAASRQPAANATGSVRTGAAGGNTGGARASTAAPRGPVKTLTNPDTGQKVVVPVNNTNAGSGSGGDNSGTGSAPVSGIPTELADYRQQNMTRVLAPLAIAEMIAVLVIPPVFYFYVIRRRRNIVVRGQNQL